MLYKFVVLDDDPTGTQCIHDLAVYTEWTQALLEKALLDKRPMFFLLTNSRSFSEQKTEQVHREIVRNLLAAGRKSGVHFGLVSRGDSTLRGHYPLEIDVLAEELQAAGVKIDGEILCPCFFEGGRITEGDVHYCLEQGRRIPVAETEFAKDATFGFTHSDLKAYIEEKSHGVYPSSEVISISCELLRAGDENAIRRLLHSGRKIIVNSTCYKELDQFTAVLNQELSAGCNYLFRVAASFTRSVSRQESHPLLSARSLGLPHNGAGGLIVVGSHTAKTNRQLIVLRHCAGLVPFEFDPSMVFKEDIDPICSEIARQADCCIRSGKTFLLYTGRTVLLANTPEESLSLSVHISSALAKIVSLLSEQPRFVMAKGGITSYDIAVYGLQVKEALVSGQVKPGVSLWLLPEDSRFAHMPYIICPGNTGDDDTLADIYSEFSSQPDM